MNAILQCLLNIDMFANDLMFDFSLIKSNTSEMAAEATDSSHNNNNNNKLPSKKQTQSGCLFK
jgi:hypothetical protein